MNANNRDFKVLNDREHVLCRPAMYVGSVNPTEREQWIYDKEKNKFHYGKVTVVPALLKCISELIDNSIDVAIDTDFKAANKIKVNITEKSVEVIDNGIGIPCEPPKGSTDNSPENTCVCLAWTRLKAGTSFDDSRKKIGTNGVGASCTNVFSTKFVGISDDGKRSQTIECSDNMSVIKASKIKKSSGKSGVKVYCEPDLKRFHLDKIDKVHIDLVYQRLVSLAICYPKITFVFNGEYIRINTKKFAQMFSDSAVIQSTENTTICIFPNEYDEFRFYSSVNGLDMFRGGVHIDTVAYEVCTRVRDKLVRKYKAIRPGDVKNKLCLAVMLTNFVNVQTDSQTKETLTNSSSEVMKHFNGEIDFDELAKHVLKCDAIIDPIVETFKIKEELKARQELKRVKKTRVRSDKFIAPTQSMKYLALCEGASAMSGISSALDNKDIGFYAMRGLPLNAYDSSMQKIVANQELKDIINILSLDISKSEDKKTIDYEKILIATDADADGTHISAMLLGWFKKFAPNLFAEGKVCKLITPLIIIEDSKGKVLKYFFDVASFKTYEKSVSKIPGKLRYLKGLGSWEKEQLISLIDQNGLDSFVVEYSLDKDGEVRLDDWLGPDAEKRKKYLRKYDFDINQV